MRSDDLEVGFSGRPTRMARRPTYRSLVAGGRLEEEEEEEQQLEQQHFLDSCFLCRKHLGSSRDIFMYRGNTPFCSEECRDEQIEIDEEIRLNKSLRKKKNSSTGGRLLNNNTNKKAAAAAQAIPFRAAGTVVA